MNEDHSWRLKLLEGQNRWYSAKKNVGQRTRN